MHRSTPAELKAQLEAERAGTPFLVFRARRGAGHPRAAGGWAPDDGARGRVRPGLRRRRRGLAPARRARARRRALGAGRPRALDQRHVPQRRAADRRARAARRRRRPPRRDRAAVPRAGRGARQPHAAGGGAERRAVADADAARGAALALPALQGREPVRHTRVQPGHRRRGVAQRPAREGAPARPLRAPRRRGPARTTPSARSWSRSPSSPARSVSGSSEPRVGDDVRRLPGRGGGGPRRDGRRLPRDALGSSAPWR